MGQLIKMSDADKGVDFTKCIQGHVSQSVRQVFTCERSRRLVHPKLMLEAMEHIVKDQFGNLYVVFTSKLMDQEVYAVVAWVGAEKWDTTKKTIKLVKEWKKFKVFGDELLACLQSMAFFTYGKANLVILKGAVAGKKIIDIPTSAELGITAKAG